MQGLDGGLRLALLDNAQDGVQQHHRQDDEHLGEGLMGQVVGDGGYGGGGHQDQQHGVLQLLDEPLKQGGLGGLPQAVGAVFRQTALRLGGGQALRAALQVRQDRSAVWAYSLCIRSLLLMILPTWGNKKTHAQAKAYA